MKDTRYTSELLHRFRPDETGPFGDAIRPVPVPMSLQLARELFPSLPNDWHGVIKHGRLYFTIAHYKQGNREAWHIFVIELDRTGKAYRRQSLDEFKWTKAEAEAYIDQLKTKYNP